MGEPENPLEQLRTLLLKEERDQLAELRLRVVDVPQRTADLAEILPAAIDVGTAQNKKLMHALRAPVSECLRESVRDDPMPLADALFPIIGPAIRKSIAEALRNFTETLNRTVEHSFSAKGLRWRIEALRTGVPFGEIVLKHTLSYRVEEVFLIHRSSGLLIEHVSREENERDNDAVSAMLTAIQDFVRDTFRSQDEIQQLELGERLVWLQRGPTVMLACLIRGVPAASARGRMQEVVERIHRTYSAELTDFRGDKSGLAGIDSELRDCLISEDRQSKASTTEMSTTRSGSRSAVKAIASLVLLAAIISLAWLWWKNWETSRQVHALAQRLDGTPGFVITSLIKSDGVWNLRGLRDPLSSDPKPAVDSAGVDPKKVLFKWTSYQSMEPAIVERRARQQLKIAPDLDVRLEGTVLAVSGSAPIAYVETLRAAYPLPAGVDRLDLQQLRISDLDSPIGD